MRISLLVQQGREGLVDQEAEDHIQHSLEEGEGHIEDGQALDEAVRGGENSLIHTDDGVQRQTVAHHIGGIHHKVVQRHRQHSFLVRLLLQVHQKYFRQHVLCS